MEVLDGIFTGIISAGTPINLMLCLAGALLGTLIGVLPGIGPTATLAILLPVTYFLPPLGALIMLAGIYYGAQYGGSTTAILVNLPGEASSVVTAIDGYQLARKGRAGAALAIAALASFFAGMVSNIFIAATGPALASWALEFGPAEYFSLALFGLMSATVLASGSPIKAIGMTVLGLLMGLIGTDVNSGGMRMTFGSVYLFDGIPFIVMAVGFFAISEILANLESPETRGSVQGKVRGLWPTREDFRRCVGPVLRATGLGTIIGILPGGGATLSSFASYALEKRISKHSAEFGHGAVEGVAAPEAANNAGAQANLVPLMVLGIPSGAISAIMLGAMTIHGIVPGPHLIDRNPDLFWGFIASMWIGNIMLLFINLPMIGLWVRLLQVPYRLMFPAILLFCCIGIYSINNSVFDVAITVAIGVIGWIARKGECSAAPLMLGFVLAPLLETNLRRTLLISGGDATAFVTRPISLTFLIATAVMLLVLLLPAIRRRREEAFSEESS
ncbi:MAG: tripartite tricarboxylate transporter permease [Rhodobacteraceae bacterium]|nr:tripartite tricarboxylate transporter permease [Paracoccaceae bacterium]